MPKAKTNRALNKARVNILNGEYEQELLVVEQAAQAGDVTASASLVYLYSYLGRWKDLLEPAVATLNEIEVYFTANVFDETVMALATAAQKTGDWAGILSYLQKNIKIKTLHNREQKVLKKLFTYLKAKGKTEDKVFPIVDMPESSPAEKAAHYRNAVDNVFEYKPKLKDPKKKVELEGHLLALAIAFDQDDEIVRRFNPKNMYHGYEEAIRVARIHAKNNKPDLAWEIIRDNVQRWWPVDRVQLMPMEPISEDCFADFMTEENCLKLLKTPKKK
ncbi:hypothetical protein IT411_02770 [Candidatus Peregrinibacteria bacterium]|nr:hypothetical protein [Candidatus Peregrinibacteria bacterium]